MNRRKFTRGLAATGVIAALPLARAADAAATHKIDISGFKFKPKKLEVKVGDTVVFKNSDGAPHTATATDRSWDTNSLDRGDSASITVTKGMTGKYFCRFHPGMKAELVITG